MAAMAPTTTPATVAVMLPVAMPVSAPSAVGPPKASVLRMFALGPFTVGEFELYTVRSVRAMVSLPLPAAVEVNDHFVEREAEHTRLAQEAVLQGGELLVERLPPHRLGSGAHE